MTQILFADDADLGIIQSRRVAVLGYGALAAAHALNLRDSGVKVIIGLPSTTRAGAKAQEQGFEVQPLAAAVAAASVVLVALPLSRQVHIYDSEVAPHLAPHDTVIFTEGFNVRYGYLRPAVGLDVGLVCPQGRVHELRDEFVAGQGIPGLIAVQQDASGMAWEVVKSYAAAIGLTRAGVVATTFAQATEAALFSEQAVLGGGLNRLIQSGFETLVEAGYQPEVAYFEVCYQLEQQARRLGEAGLWGRRTAASDLAEYGGYTGGTRVITPEVKTQMKAVLAAIQSGEFAARFMADQNAGAVELKTLRAANENHVLESVGTRLRQLAPKTVP
ncbi:ketol-acid reductoisomerase [Mobiluncus mulieris]|uniref:ketol-acid reductoisomerase n=1 Tax=Mobiluncus mulieris TaxID=2052 RepID=UPI00242AE50B|nr:ketol-acid reductoisomerase [Mobiluncus mulieris]